MVRIDRSKCIGCGACVGVCPKNALRLKGGAIVVDRSLCIKCGTCAKACPANAIRVNGTGAK